MLPQTQVQTKMQLQAAVDEAVKTPDALLTRPDPNTELLPGRVAALCCSAAIELEAFVRDLLVLAKAGPCAPDEELVRASGDGGACVYK